jgi:hypothetical protein
VARQPGRPTFNGKAIIENSNPNSPAADNPEDVFTDELLVSIDVIRERFHRRGYRLAITGSNNRSTPAFVATAVRPLGGETYAGSADTDIGAAYSCWKDFQARHQRHPN